MKTTSTARRSAARRAATALAAAGAAVALTAGAASASGSFSQFEVLTQNSVNRLVAEFPASQLSTNSFVAPDSSPALADLGGGGVEIAFAASDHTLWRGSPESNAFVAGFEVGRHLTLAPGTSPAVAGDGHGGWKIAIHGSNGDLQTIDSADTIIDTGAAMAPGSSPSVAYLPAAHGYEFTFAGPDNLLWRAFPDTNAFHVSGGLGVQPGTSPAIATDGNAGFKIAFHAQGGDHMWTAASNGVVTDSGTAMSAGSSPALAFLPIAGGYEITFAGSDNLLWRAFPDTNAFHVGAGLGVAPGTSPTIATGGPAAWEIAFHAPGDHLWTADGAGAVVDTQLVLSAGISPSVAARTS
ncbi:MAG: hypothetical protein HOW97_07805 [Catenulispora sp.]|nr:hypothetical protein [Catenulispora sp.]